MKTYNGAIVIKLSSNYVTMKNKSFGKSIRVSVRTYDELAQLGNLSDSFDSVISKILKESEAIKSTLVTNMKSEGE